ncbi:MAG: hypothetical protein HY700_16445 [Gemmatimonadetes bacterium]|nr:hypothetical protein [Gemmatimonadota bacterium]
MAWSASHAATAAAQDSVQADSSRSRLVLDMPVFDYPANTAAGFAFPSMEQSLDISKAFYQLSTRLLHRTLPGNRFSTRLFRASIEILLATFPFGDAWLHEEWHRAVLRNRGIGSFNDAYKFRIFSTAISVSHVRDEDLIRLKRDYPADQVRLAEAGIEGEYQQVTEGTKDRVFLDANPQGNVTRFLSVTNAILYLGLSSLNATDRRTDEFNRKDGADIPRRDALGWDFTAWIYDLSRPDEPYEARGIHPSGVGMDRYIKPLDLTPDEKRFLRLQGGLALLNLVDPNLYRRRPFTVGDSGTSVPLQYTFGLRHMLTSFGYTIDANLFFKEAATNLYVVLHSYFNNEHYFPGAELELVRYPVTIAGRPFEVSPRVAGWLQPEGQRFRATKPVAGGLGSFRLGSSAANPGVGWFVEVSAKSAGWVAGEVELGNEIGAKVGISAVLR